MMCSIRLWRQATWLIYSWAVSSVEGSPGQGMQWAILVKRSTIIKIIDFDSFRIKSNPIAAQD